jgi:hypothetical protein
MLELAYTILVMVLLQEFALFLEQVGKFDKISINN